MKQEQMYRILSHQEVWRNYKVSTRFSPSLLLRPELIKSLNYVFQSSRLLKYISYSIILILSYPPYPPLLTLSYPRPFASYLFITSLLILSCSHPFNLYPAMPLTLQPLSCHARTPAILILSCPQTFQFLSYFLSLLIQSSLASLSCHAPLTSLSGQASAPPILILSCPTLQYNIIPPPFI